MSTLSSIKARVSRKNHNIPYIHAPTCYVKDDTLFVVAGKGNMKSGVEQEAPQQVSSGVWSIQLPPLR